MPHQHQELFDSAWKNEANSMGELFTLAQSYSLNSEHQLASECFRNSAMAYRHQAFRVENQKEELRLLMEKQQQAMKIYERWIFLNEGKPKRVYPMVLNTIELKTVTSLIVQSMREPLLSDEMEYLEDLGHQSLRNTLFECLYPAFGFHGADHYLRQTKFRIALDPIVDYITAKATGSDWSYVATNRGRSFRTTRRV